MTATVKNHGVREATDANSRYLGSFLAYPASWPRCLWSSAPSLRRYKLTIYYPKSFQIIYWALSHSRLAIGNRFPGCPRGVSKGKTEKA